MPIRPNLSIEHLAMTLAALGTTAVVTACTRAEPAGVRADQPTSSAAAPPPPPPQTVPEETHKKSDGENEPAPTTVATATATASAHARPIMAPKKPGDKGSSGQASCGAGTCTADPKKK